MRISGTIIRNWTSAGSSTAVTATGLSLVNGVTYYIGVRAKNGAGLFSAAAYSNGIAVQADTTPPTGTIQINSGTTYATAATVTLTLSATDNSGTVLQMQFSNDGVTYSTPEAYATSKSWTLTSGDGSKTVYAKFQDPAGNWSAAANDTIILDTTPPTVPTVTDDGTYTTSTTQLHATWTASSDPESGVAEYQYAIGTTVGGTDVLSWASAGIATEITKTGLNLTNGAKYYISVKAKNGAGVWSIAGNSDGITADSTAPITPTVTDDGTYTTSSSQLHAAWISSDAESGVVEYQYQIRQDSLTGTVIVDWTSTGTAMEVTRIGLSLTVGKTYYFSVKAKNGAGLWSTVGTSDGILCKPTGPNFEVTYPQEGSWIGSS